VSGIDNRHIVIIGAGPGIGASVARRFASEGFRLTLVARDLGRLNALADDLRSGGSRVDVRQADAANASGLRSALASIAEDSAPPAVVVYNAAMLKPTSLLDVGLDDLERGYAVDLIGAVSAAQVFLPAMREARSGTLLFTSGSAAIRPSAGIATVSLGKAALRSAATMLASQVLDDGVHVVSITVSGAVKPGTAFDPDLIADLYWQLHTQPVADWAAEEPFDGRERGTRPIA
jgi:short-subunit dehydrogenase